MRLREYGRDSTAPGESTRFGIRARMAAVGLFLVLLLGTGVAFFVKSESGAVPTDGVTLCPTKRPPSEIVVILLDVSDQFSEPQRLQVQSHLARVRDSIPRFGLVEVYTVDRLGRRVTEHVTHICNPGAGDDLSQIYQNPALARKKWRGFADKLTSDIDQQIRAPRMKTSPIFEAIQATALRTFGKPEYDGLPKHLVIVSDLMQNVPGALSMYKDVPSFEKFKNTQYFSRIRGDLQGVSVLIFYLVRTQAPKQTPEHLGFWRDYFRFQGATIESVDRVFGDK
ncbi:MAG TPA: hypothetical protein VFS51_12010 [Gemmatimonadales bacterium]|nr:hypothetical protein [Gemmatimonadales bacterium]